MSAVDSRVIPVDAKLSVGQALFYGFQSVIAMNLFLGAFIIAGLLHMDPRQTALLIGMSFLASGIGTFIQATFFVRYPVIQSLSFATIGAIVAVGFRLGLPTVFGSLIPGAILVIIVGYLNIFSKIVKALIPGLVAGLVVVVIGINLMVIIWQGVIGTPGSPGINFAEVGITVALIIGFMLIGSSKMRAAISVGRGAVLYALILSTFIASFMGTVNLAPVKAAPWFALPRIFPFGKPVFDLSSTLIFTFIYFIVMVEAIGCWVATSGVTGEKLTDKRINAGIRGEGFGCLLGALFGGAPATSIAPNCGVLATTKVYSRWAATAAGCIILVLSFCPKLMTLIAVVPGPIMLGVSLFTTMMILMNGTIMVLRFEMNERNVLVVGIPIFITVGVSLLPPSLVGKLPTLLNYLFSSGIAVGCLAAILINLIIPERKETASSDTPATPIDAPVSSSAVAGAD